MGEEVLVAPTGGRRKPRVDVNVVGDPEADVGPGSNPGTAKGRSSKRRKGLGPGENSAADLDQGGNPPPALPPSPLTRKLEHEARNASMEDLRGLALPPRAAGGRYENVAGSIVKVFCVHCEPNFSLPWWVVSPPRLVALACLTSSSRCALQRRQKKRQYTSTSSGFVIDSQKRHILTNAHCVDYHTQARWTAPSSPLDGSGMQLIDGSRPLGTPGWRTSRDSEWGR